MTPTIAQFIVPALSSMPSSIKITNEEQKQELGLWLTNLVASAVKGAASQLKTTDTLTDTEILEKEYGKPIEVTYPVVNYENDWEPLTPGTATYSSWKKNCKAPIKPNFMVKDTVERKKFIEAIDKINTPVEQGGLGIMHYDVDNSKNHDTRWQCAIGYLQSLKQDDEPVRIYVLLL